MNKQKLDDLRKRAEETLRARNDAFTENSGDELRTALHELHTHQIELELQNEELRRAQEELLETRDQYVDLYDFAPVGYLTLSEKNLIVEANLTFSGLLSEERSSLLGRPFSQFIAHEDQDLFYKHFREITGSKVRQACELRIRKKDGDWFWAKLECVPKEKSDSSGNLIRIALHDITESKRLATELINMKKLEATALLAGGIAHDFNNLLAVILGNIEMAQDDVLVGRSFTKKLQDALNACLGAAELTKKFLTFSSGGAPSKTLTHVETFITDAASLALAGSNVKLKCSCPAGLWPVEIDVPQMAQAIGNVITNSVEAMPQGGVIQIRAENVDSVLEENREFPGGQDTKYVKISIEDQGVGVPNDVLPQVFDPYFSSKTTWHKKGLGLGLAITYSIIKKHGGLIDLASQQNIGTTVSIYLPKSDKEIVSPETKSQNAFPVNKKILFMDDEEMLRIMAGDMLEKLGYEVEMAYNGEEALLMYLKAKRAGSPFGVVILDLTIKGGMGGRETIKRLKELDPDIRAIVASGYSHDPVMANCKDYGFVDALYKPYLLKDLEKSLRAVTHFCVMHRSGI